MIFSNDGEFTPENVKEAINRYNRIRKANEERYVYTGEDPALFVVPELFYQAKEILFGTGVPVKRIFTVRSPDFWFVANISLAVITERKLEIRK